MAEFNGYELPKLTLRLDENLTDALDKSKTPRERAGLQLAVLREVLSERYVAERCGGCEVEDVDVVELAALTAEVYAAYHSHAESADMERLAAQLEQLAPMLDQLERVGRVLGNTQTRQGFSRVI